MKSGWRKRRLGELCQLISGQHIVSTDYNTEGRGIGYLTGPSDFGAVSPVVSKWTEHPKVTAVAGDILITVKGSGVGSVNRLDDSEVAISRQLMAVRAIDAEPRFIHAFLTSTFDYFQSLATGAAIPGISREQVLGLEIVTPPLAEQQRIVGVLDEACAGLATAQAHAEQNLQNARALFESYLQAVFTQKGEGWVEKRLGDVFDIGSSKRIRENEWTSSGVPFYGGKEIVRLARGEYASSNNYISEEKYDEYASKHDMPKAGDLLITARGTIGVGYVVREGDKFYYKDGNIISFRARVPVNPLFVLYAFRSKPLIEQFAGLTGATVKHLPIEKANALILGIPGVAHQDSIVERLEDIEVETRRLESVYQQKLEALGALKKSLLHQAFSGAL